MKAVTLNHGPRSAPSPRLRLYEEGSLICSGPSCSKPMPGGYYGRSKRIYLCSSQCFNTWHISNKALTICTYCGIGFQRRHTQKTMPFCNAAHHFEWRKMQTEKKVGPWATIFRAFLQDCAPRFLAPTSLNNTRYNLAAFFSFIQRKKIKDLEKVTPKVMSAFLIDLKKTRKKSAGRVIGNLSLFFNWQLMNGERKSPNPVIPRFHTQTSVVRLPRPYTSEEMTLMRSLLAASGNTVLQLAFAIGEESGLRISEVTNLRLEDVDVERQQLFVRLPTKTRCERFSPFHDRTMKALSDWRIQRPPMNHEYLLTGFGGIPLQKHTLRLRLNRLLTGKGKLTSFSFHRLRHTAASRVYPAMEPRAVMQTFGWTSERVMAGYARMPTEKLRASYFRAMDETRPVPEQIDPASLSIEAYFESATPLN